MDAFVGEPLALDLINTIVATPTGEVDHLDRVEDFQAWLELETDRLVMPDAVAADELAGVRELREHIRGALSAALQNNVIPDTCLAALESATREAPAYRVLQPDLTTRTRRDGTPAAQLRAQFAEAAVALLSDPAVAKIRTCEGPRCRMLFLPAHPRRRWCSPDVCGNRARVARYYSRHKDR